LKTLIPEYQVATKKVQDYLYPSPPARSKKYVIVPSQGFLWVGEPFIAKWVGPRETFEASKFYLEKLLEHRIRVKLTFGQIKQYGLIPDIYIGLRAIGNYEEYSEAYCEIMPQHKFVVYYDNHYPVADMKVMRPGSVGLLRTEDILETFKHEKLKFPYGG